MTITEFIQTAPAERQATLTKFHELILANDPGVIASIKPMMGKDMIMYEERKYMKYALANAKAHLSLHCLPIYMNPVFHERYTPLLPKAKIQKGCINFTDEADFPASVLVQLIRDCAPISIADLLEKRKKK